MMVLIGRQRVKIQPVRCIARRLLSACSINLSLKPWLSFLSSDVVCLTFFLVFAIIVFSVPLNRFCLNHLFALFKRRYVIS